MWKCQPGRVDLIYYIMYEPTFRCGLKSVHYRLGSVAFDRAYCSTDKLNRPQNGVLMEFQKRRGQQVYYFARFDTKLFIISAKKAYIAECSAKSTDPNLATTFQITNNKG